MKDQHLQRIYRDYVYPIIEDLESEKHYLSQLEDDLEYYHSLRELIIERNNAIISIHFQENAINIDEEIKFCKTHISSTKTRINELNSKKSEFMKMLKEKGYKEEC